MNCLEPWRQKADSFLTPKTPTKKEKGTRYFSRGATIKYFFNVWVYYIYTLGVAYYMSCMGADAGLLHRQAKRKYAHSFILLKYLSKCRTQI